MKRRIFVLSIISLASCTSAALSQDNCSALLQHGISDITTKYGADYSLVTNYQKHCGSIDESTSNRTVAQAGFEIFGYFGGDADADVQSTRQKIQNWCDVNKSFAEANSSFFEEARTINTSAVQAYQACQQFNRRDIKISVQREDEAAKSVTITIDSYSDGEYTFLGMVNKGFSCQYFIAEDNAAERDLKALDSTTRVNIPLRNDNIHITCSRSAPSVDERDDGLKLLTFESGSIQIVTSGPAMQLDFPEVVETYYSTPKGTVLPILGSDCPAGWQKLNDASGRFLVGASDKIALGSKGGRADIPQEADHSHNGTTGEQHITSAHPNGMTRAPGDNRWLHDHHFTTSSAGKHNHGGNNMPPYLSVTYCTN